MKYIVKSIIIFVSIFICCSSCSVQHFHEFIEGKCICGEVDPNYKTPHIHEYREGKCNCGEVDPNYNKEQYTITFINYDNSVIQQIVIEKGELPNYPDAPSREGYTFIGWDHDLKDISSDLVIKAMYEQIEEKIVVGPSEKYNTLEEALNVANDGDIIYVEAGTYLGCIINKEVEIRGNNYNIDPLKNRNEETIFTTDLVINASNVTINGIELTQKAKFTFDDLSYDVRQVSFHYCKVTDSSINDNNERNVAPFNLVSNNDCYIYDIVIDNCYISKNDKGRPMVMYIVDVENLTVQNCTFLGGDTKKNYNDAVKIDNKENGNALFGIRGNVVFENNVFQDYYQYGLWFRQYSSGKYVIKNNKFVNIGQTEDAHAAINFISGLDINELDIEIKDNHIINSYLLFRMDSISGDLESINCKINENVLQKSLGICYIKNNVLDFKINAQYNYYGEEYPSSDKFIGNIDYSNYYNDVYDLEGYEKIELTYKTTPYVEVNRSILINCDTFGFDKKNIIWESSDESIATVNELGEVTGVNKGTVVITAIAEDYNLEKSIIVEVYENIDEMEEVVQFILSTMNSYSYSSTAANSRTNYGITNPNYYSIFRGAMTFLFEDLEIDTESYVRRGSASLVNDKVEYITIHDTWALPRTAKGLAEFFLTDKTSIHYTVGNDGLYQIVRLTDKAAHAGDSQFRAYGLDKTNVLASTDKPVITMINGYFAINGIVTDLRPYVDYEGTIQDMENYTTEQLTYSGIRCIIGDDGYYYLGKTYFNETYKTVSNFGGNASSIGIEMESQPGTDFYLNMQRTAKLVAMLMDKYNLSTNDVKMHNYFSGKNCAQLLKNNLKFELDYQIDKHNIEDVLWDEFLDLCNVELKMLQYNKDYKFEFISSDLSKIKNNGRIINHNVESECVSYIIRITNLKTQEVTEINSSIIIPSCIDIDRDYITKR